MYNCSFLLLVIPILVIKVPFYIAYSIFSLLVSSFLYHNYYNVNTLSGYFILLYDQLNIMNTCILISFQSLPFSIDYMMMYLLEKYLYNRNWTCCFIYLLSFLNMMNIPLSILFCINTLIYVMTQNREFENYERYLWHLFQSIYITLALSKLYPFRFIRSRSKIK